MYNTVDMELYRFAAGVFNIAYQGYYAVFSQEQKKYHSCEH